MKPLFEDGPLSGGAVDPLLAPQPPLLAVELNRVEVCASAATSETDVGFDWQFEPAEGGEPTTMVSSLSPEMCAPASPGPMTVRVRAARSEASAWVSTVVDVPAVGAPALDLVLENETFTAYAGNTVVVEGDVVSVDGFDASVTIGAVVPAGFGPVMPDSTYLSEDDSDPFDLSVAIPGGLVPGTYQVDIVAQGAGVSTTRAVTITVEKPSVTITANASTVTVRRSYSTRVEGTVQAKGVNGWASTKLLGLPANLSASSDLVSLGSGQDSFSFSLRASSWATVGTYSARLVVESMSGVVLAEVPITIVVK